MNETIKKVNVEITGKTPLLMAKFYDSNLLPKTKRAATSKDLTPREIAERIAYRMTDDENSELCIESRAIMASMINAGRDPKFKIGKRQIATRDSTLIYGFLQIEPIYCTLGVTDFEVDSTSGRNKTVDARIMIHRPRLDKWKTQFTLYIDTAEVETDFIYNLLAEAGRKCGIYAWRPACKGPYGTFNITKFEVEGEEFKKKKKK
jgi:hypothetical protein